MQIVKSECYKFAELCNPIPLWNKIISCPHKLEGSVGNGFLRKKDNLLSVFWSFCKILNVILKRSKFKSGIQIKSDFKY